MSPLTRPFFPRVTATLVVFLLSALGLQAQADLAGRYIGSVNAQVRRAVES